MERRSLAAGSSLDVLRGRPTGAALKEEHTTQKTSVFCYLFFFFVRENVLYSKNNVVWVFTFLLTLFNNSYE